MIRESRLFAMVSAREHGVVPLETRHVRDSSFHRGNFVPIFTTGRTLLRHATIESL